VDYLNQQKLLPVLYFCFSRKRCERMAHSYSNRQLTDAETSQKAVMWFEEYLETHGLAWSRSARELTETIASGVAWHHAGVLPPLKEAVEILFSRGWIRLLFATETFARGINMPARSVIFSSLEKNDGIAFRYLRAYEFQQMAGRAGRRGIDTEGDVVVNLEPKYARFEETRDTVFGLVEPLASRFAFSYSSLMNLYERHDMQEIHQLATHSLASYQQELSSERLEKSITKLKEEVENLVCSRSKGLAMERILVFHNLTEELQTCKDKMDSIRQTMRRKPMAEKQQYHGQLTDLSEKIVFIKKNLAKNRCKKCYDGSNCMSYIQRLKRLEKRRHKGGNRMLELIDRKFACLQELKFVNETGLLPRGEFARNIFGYEIQATELYFEGWLNTTDPLEILAVLATVTFEKRRDEDGRCRDRRYRNVVRKFIERIEQLKKIEYSILKIETIPLPDAGFVDPVLLWAAGADFEQLSVSFPDFAEGDMIRQFRQIIDLLRQLKRAMKNDEFTRDKLNTCTELINRDVVDAEQYL
jgi:superfamily II RNA helicase